MTINEIEGGVCAAEGFFANAVHCGIRKNREKVDLALIKSEKKAAAAAVYTTNLVKGAPLKVTKDHISDGYASAIICNSGNANTCAEGGEELALRTCELLAAEIGVKAEDIIVASTGVIGQKMSIEPFESGIPPLASGLGKKSSLACEGIMTTDTVKKEVAVSFKIDGKECHMGGIAKGSGMINPNMATMLVFITTDCAITPKMLQKAISGSIKNTYNMVSVDGDTSTNDMLTVMANGMAQNSEITEEGDSFKAFFEALEYVNYKLCRMIAADGEGATKMLQCNVTGAKTKKDADLVAKSVISSSLLKAAMFGCDANWGRVLCAAGYSGADIDPDKIDVEFSSAAGDITVCKKGCGNDFSEENAKKILSEKEIYINISLGVGEYNSFALGCDLTYDYVKINGDYRT